MTHRTCFFPFPDVVAFDNIADKLLALQNQSNDSSDVVYALDIEYDTNTQWEYLGGAAYALNKRLSLTAIYDSDHGFGAGVLFRF